MNIEVNNEVIVWGHDDFNTLGLMRELGESDLKLLFLIKGNANFAARSKYCKKYHETHSLEDGLEYLMKTFANSDIKPIVITSSDEIMVFIDRHRAQMESVFILPGTSVGGNTEKYIDKNNLTALAKEIGLLCPDSHEFKWDTKPNNIKYPCIIKPSHQKPGHYNEFKFKICKNESALKKTLKLVRKDSVFIVQERIPKERDLLVYGARMRDGNTVFAGAMIRDRMADSGSFSHGIMTDVIPQGADTAKMAEFLETIDFYGPFSFEFGLVGDKAYFFEVNLRNDGTSHYFYQSGANIPLAYVYSCAGLDYSLIPTKVAEEKLFIDELFDIENVIHRRLTRKQWKKDLSEANVYKYYAEDDPIPYEIVKKGQLKQIAQDLILMRFRLYVVFVLDKLGLRK